MSSLAVATSPETPLQMNERLRAAGLVPDTAALVAAVLYLQRRLLTHLLEQGIDLPPDLEAEVEALDAGTDPTTPVTTPEEG